MAMDVFLKLDGIKGESTVRGHEDELQLVNASFEVTNKAPAGAGAGAGKAQLQDFHFTKTVDSASPQLFLFCSSGKHIPTATLTTVPAGDTGNHLTIVMTDALVTSYQISLNQQTPSEVFTLQFSSLKMSYQTQNDKGAVAGTVQGGWDVSKNQTV